MNDLISRQEAIDALANMHCKSDEDGYVWIIRSDAWARIDALPSVTPKQRWIPCGKCIHADGKHRWCKILDRSINEDYFCCWAEPYREEGDE